MAKDKKKKVQSRSRSRSNDDRSGKAGQTKTDQKNKEIEEKKV